MGSRRGMGALQITVPSPMRFVKRPSAFNSCVGAALRGATYSRPAPGLGGKRDQRIQNAFTQAVRSCAGRRGAA